MNILLSAAENMDEVTHELYTREYLFYISSVLSYVSAILLILIVIIVPLVMVIDVAYLIVPAFKYYYDTQIKGNSDIKAKVVEHLIVSKNAIEAYDDSQTTNKPVLFCYMKRSLKFYILVVTVVVLLATGLDTILDLMLRLLSGFLELI